jgi:hypothetical protein
MMFMNFGNATLGERASGGYAKIAETDRERTADLIRGRVRSM